MGLIAATTLGISSIIRYSQARVFDRGEMYAVAAISLLAAAAAAKKVRSPNVMPKSR